MFWRLGWFLNSLAYQIEKNLKETIYNSEAYKSNKWNYVESQIIQWSKNPFRYIFGICLALTLLLVAGILLKENLYPLSSRILYEWRWLDNWQTDMLSVQVTLVGVVLPLAISLVGFLLQDKTASNAIWSLYRQYSGFLFIGYSGLAALVFIMVGPYVETLLPPVSYSLWCVLSYTWVSINILLTGWFIRTTLLIVHEPSRDNLLLRYTINESFTDGIRMRLSLLIPKNIIGSKLVSKPEIANIEISTIRISKQNENVISIKFKNKRYVSGVYFRVLNAAIYFATKQKRRGEGNKEITVPLTVNNNASTEHVLAVFDGMKPNLLSKILFRFSYRFSKIKPLQDDLVDDILFSLVGSASDDLGKKNQSLFKQSVDRIAYWHCTVNDAFTFINDDNQDDNWLLLPSSILWSRSYLDQILQEYHHLTIQTVSVLPESVSFFNSMAHLQLKINNWGDRRLPEKITQELVYSSYLTWIALVRWASTTNKVPGTLIYNQYESALLAYVGAWESWPQYLEPHSRRGKSKNNSVQLFLQHLRCTSQQVVFAFRHREEMAAEWATDMLLNWFTNISYHEYPRGQYFWNHELITTNILDRESNSDIWQFILNQDEYDEASANRLAMENAWLDVRLICAAYLETHATENNGVFLQKLLNALIDNKRLKPTGGIDMAEQSLSTGGDILAAYIRQRCYWDNGDKSYGVWLDSIVDAYTLIDEPKRVSGRIYSSVGANDVRSLQAAYVRLSVIKSNQLWSLSQRWIEIIFSPVYKQIHRDQLISDLKAWLNIANTQITQRNEIFTQERISNFTISLEKLVSQMENRSIDGIRDAPIDQNRLLDFGRFASKSGFSKDKGSILLRLFSRVKKAELVLQTALNVLNISGYSKRDIAKGIEVNRAINEEEWIDDVVNMHVSNSLFSKLCALPHAIEAQFESNLDLLKRLSADIRQNSSKYGNLSAFIGPWDLHRLLSEMIFESDVNKGLNIELKQGFGGSYICHLEDCAVYQMPDHRGDLSLLVPNSVFESITFNEFSDDRFVDVAYENLNLETLKLTLVFTYYMEVKFGSDPIYRYMSPKDADC